MSDLLTRIRTVASSFVTYAVIAVAAINALVAGLEPYGDVRYVGVIIQGAVFAATAIGGAVTIVRNVMPVRGSLFVGLKPLEQLLTEEPELPEDVDPFDEFWEYDGGPS